MPWVFFYVAFATFGVIINLRGDFMKISDSIKNFIENSDDAGVVFSKEKGRWQKATDDYVDLHMFAFSDTEFGIYITSDVGYEPILKCRDFLTDELNFELETEYGLTDVTQKYLYKGTRFQLQFFEEHDMIMLKIFDEDIIPLWLLETARCLVKLCKEKEG